MPHDVFISYSSKDKAIADAICHHLEEKHIRCWIAPRDVIGGENWSGAIVEAIETSKLMLLLYSGNSNASEQVLREVNCAVNSGVTILPVRLEDIPMSKSLQYYIATPHWLDMLTPPVEKHLEYLGGTVRILLDRTIEPGLPLRIQQLTDQAEKGDSESMVNLGLAYTWGNEVPINYQISTDWFRKAALLGHSMGMNNYGYALREGHGTEINYKEAIYWLEKAASQSNAIAISNLGGMYKDGLGVPKDIHKAVQLMSKAVELGEPYAMLHLGNLYHSEPGMYKDYQKTFDLYNKGARMGNVYCMHNMGMLYENGQGVERDEFKAVEWYRRAASKGFHLSKERLTILGYTDNTS